MKLTNYIRQAFVTSAMNDVPKVDHEQGIRDLINKKSAAYLKEAGFSKNVDTSRLDQNNIRLSVKSFYISFATKGLTYEERVALTKDEEILAHVYLYVAQAEKRQALSDKLQGIAAGCTTRKQLVELLPDFEKYLPADTPKPGANLPAISNLVGDFVRAGWPKNKTPATVSAKT